MRTIMKMLLIVAGLLSEDALCYAFMSSCSSRRRYWPSNLVRSTALSSPKYAYGEPLSGEEVVNRFKKEMERLREKDRKSLALSPEDITIAYEDDHIVVVDKPAGLLCVPNSEQSDIPSLAALMFERFQRQLQNSQTTSGENVVGNMNRMVVHRLGMDTSGLIVFVKTMEALREMNALFRTRKVTRVYEALLCGHLPVEGGNAPSSGLINLPLMRDYEFPPYMRVSTDKHQRMLIDLDPDVVGRKLLEPPKASLTQYQVMGLETLEGDDALPVTRVTLTSISGRTHQLNVHCAAMGHPIVGDRTYGFSGNAAPFGGLDADELPDHVVSDEVQKQIAAAVEAAGMNMCVHAKLLKFRHPVNGEELEFSSVIPF